QKGNYPADIGRVRSLLLALAEARRIEPKTSNPDYYERLGVQALGSGENFRIKLGGVDVPGLLVGDSVPGRGAFYARLDGMAASWLASGTVDVPLDPQQWLDTDLLDIAAARIADITISHPDDSSLTVARPVFGGDLVLEEKPEARELARANILDDVAGSLATLTLTDVQRRDTLELPSDPVRVRARTVDGLVIDATLYAVDDRRYLALETGVDESVASRFRPTADDDDPENETGETDLPPPDMSEVEREATQLNERLAGWIFSIGTARYDQLTRRLEDLLAAVEPD
ncbi:MAG: DUF4340 domain-containing protein, partial [Gammaproteobacteria bacterium]|nr:DUF4340 domain-containing protein [Gammaproteobacteria bacterium]